MTAPLLTKADVAAYLQCSQRQVTRLKIPCVHIGRLVRYSPHDVAKFVEARRY